MRRHLLVLVIAGVCAGQEPPAAPEAPPVRQKSRFDPPATLGHLETTTPEQRKQIDDLIVVMFDLQRGRESLDAKAKLVSIGKPAFLPILGRMARIRDSIADDDSENERVMESTLMLGDMCLREMDGFLDAKELPEIARWLNEHHAPGPAPKPKK